ncbi:hypothetical protein [Embleya sp. NBC_00896]|uniref:hypothetical protein n=1 Tax=Embleya sp. NBC_00896 TaxID=2975961 RepID=UPI002F90DE6C|nr:hypothetical protein OG928_36830 [Embleya sp. NBC_00896]
MSHSSPPQPHAFGPGPQPWGSPQSPQSLQPPTTPVGPAAPRKVRVALVGLLITLASAAVIVFVVLWVHNVSQSAGHVDRSDLKDLPGPRSNVGIGAPAAPTAGGGS